jgi:hypothetical protein
MDRDGGRWLNRLGQYGPVKTWTSRVGAKPRMHCAVSSAPAASRDDVTQAGRSKPHLDPAEPEMRRTRKRCGLAWAAVAAKAAGALVFGGAAEAALLGPEETVT